MGANKIKLLFVLSVICMALLSASFLVMPYGSEQSLAGDNTFLILSGLLFWIPLVGACTCLLLVNRERKKQDKRKNKPRWFQTVGIIRFFTNKPAALADALWIGSLTGFIVFMAVNQTGYGVYVFLCLTVFTLQLHCVLNGENYKFVKKTAGRDKEEV